MANKITEGLRTFLKCFLENADKQSRSHATNTISARNFLMVESEETFSSLLFWKHGAVNEFYGAFDISFQMREPGFSVVHGLQKLLHTATCT